MRNSATPHALPANSAPSERGTLAVLDEASRLLSSARNLDEIKDVRDKAEAARTYAKTARLGMDLQNLAAELKLRAERKAGDYLGQLSLRGGNRRSESKHAALKLEDFGISKHQSARWQLQAAVPQEEFERYLEERRSIGREITTAGLMRVAARSRARGVGSGRRCAGPVVEQPSEERVIAELLAVAQELIAELRHHRSGLAVILQPLVEGEGELGVNDRRMARYLLGELARVVEELAAVAK